MRGHRYAFLDGIRGIAAVFIVFRHTEIFWSTSFRRSYLAVDLFFILSGFVIAHAYDEKLASGAMRFSEFMRARVIRLYPMFFLSVLFCIPLRIGKLLTSGNTDTRSVVGVLIVFASTLLCLPSHDGNTLFLFPLNGAYWSLFFELASNAIYGVLRPILNQRILACVIVFSATALVIAVHANGNMDLGYQWSALSIAGGFLRSVFGITVGLVLFGYRNSFPKALGGGMWPWAAVFLTALVLASPSADQFNWIVDLVAVFAVFPLVVFTAAQGTANSNRLLLALGATSYPLYVLHFPLGTIITHAMPFLVFHYAPWSGIVLLAFLLLLSYSLETYIDIPLRRELTKHLRPTTRHDASAEKECAMMQ